MSLVSLTPPRGPMTGTAARRITRLSAQKESSSSSRNKTAASSKSPSPVAKKKAKLQTVKTPPNNEGRTTTSDFGSGPWYHKFTKGDEEYDRYMATEWGFEKVRTSWKI